MQETSGLLTLGESAPTKVKVDAEEAILHITDQSVMFERGGRVDGFERSAIRMVKPDGDAMIIAYSAGSEVKSVRVEPMTAVASLLVPGARSGSPPGAQGTASTGSLDEVFERLYKGSRKELEERLALVQEQPENKGLRLTQAEEEKYTQASKQMEGILAAKFEFDARAEDTPMSFWGLEKQPYQLQLGVIKTRHVRFLRLMVDPTAEKSDVVYSSDEVWPEDWPQILERFNLGSGPYTTKMFDSYVNYLKSHWKYRPGQRKPVLAHT